MRKRRFAARNLARRTSLPRGPRPSSVARVAGIDYLDLDRHLGYALRRAQVAAFDAFHRATAGAGITPPRFTALVILQANPGISQSILGEVLGTARSGAMLLTDWLEAQDLAERRHRSDDGRAWGLYLTGKGQRLIQRLRRRVRAYDRRFAARIRPGERRKLLRLLEKLAR
jgi:DNA-binding MarR family transcriptional regulator